MIPLKSNVFIQSPETLEVNAPKIAHLGSPKLRIGLYVLTYFLVKVLSFQFPELLGLVASICPAAGIALAAFLLSPRRFWATLAGCLFVAGLAANLTTDRPFMVSVGLMVANICESTASAWLIIRICGDRVSFTQIRDVLTLAAAACLINAVTSLLGAGVASLTIRSQFWRFYQTWWIADGLGILLITPMIVLWANTRLSLLNIRWGRLLEKGVLFCLCCLTTWLAFSRWESALIHVDIQPYLLFVFILWSAIRFGPRGTATLLSVGSLIAVCCTAANIGSFQLGGVDHTQCLLSVQMFLGVMGLSGLMLAAAVAQQKASEKEYCDLIENSHDIIYKITSEGVFIFVSPAWTVLLGHPTSQIFGQSFQQFVHPDDIAECWSWLRKVIETGQRKEGVEYRVRHADGSWRWHTSGAVPFRNETGKVIGFDGIAYDITERKATEKALLDMAEAKTKFASVVSHELRSPLATIKEATNLILEGVLGPVNDGQKDMLNTAKINIDRLGRLVNNVLAFHKMEANKTEYDFLEHDVNDVVKEAHINAALYAGARKADVMMELGADLPKTKFDTDKIMQVLINLLANAIKYSKSGPVVVQTRLENREIKISVRDSGQGIHPEELDEIFKPFVQAKGKKTGGTGLGLAIAREIVLAHHGRIWVESEVGKGSTFYFTLPVT
jgi:PAS domain S-box-containing protein